MPELNISIKKAFDFAGREIVENILFYLGISALIVFGPLALSTIFILLAVLIEGLSSLGASFILYFTPVALLLLSSFLFTGLILTVLKAKRGDDLSYDSLLERKDLTVNLAASGIIYGLLVSLGLILFVIPGVFLAIRLFFFDFIVVDKEVGPIKAFKESFEITKGYEWELLLFLIILIPLSFALTLSLAPLGILICSPLIYLIRGDVYNQLK